MTDFRNIILVCSCKNETFLLRASGVISCAKCDAEMDLTADNLWGEIVDRDQIAGNQSSEVVSPEVVGNDVGDVRDQQAEADAATSGQPATVRGVSSGDGDDNEPELDFKKRSLE